MHRSRESAVFWYPDTRQAGFSAGSLGKISRTLEREMRNIAKHAISGKIVEFLRRNFAFNQTGTYFKQYFGLVR